jgi:threonine dehydratase
MPPTHANVLAAARRLAGHSIVTPLLRSPVLDELTGARVLLKAEGLQIAGAFKFRGAFNKLVQLDSEARARGAVAWSSGNHAQGVAAAAQRLGIHATIVIPRDAPAMKIANTRRMGADVVLYDRYTESREDIGRALAARNGATIVPPYDDPEIIAGQGTAALELWQQARAAGIDAIDSLLVPCSGGGLVAGCALAFEGVSSATKVYAVEPAGFDDTGRSLASGQRETNVAGAKSVCDALLVPTPGEITFEVNRRLLAGALAVTDEQVFDAMRFAWRELKIVVEPGGAVALAALIAGALACRGSTVAIVLSGANVDAQLYRTVLEAE